MLQRAVEVGCVKMMVTGSCFGSSRAGVEMAGEKGEWVGFYFLLGRWEFVALFVGFHLREFGFDISIHFV